MLGSWALCENIVKNVASVKMRWGACRWMVKLKRSFIGVFKLLAIPEADAVAQILVAAQAVAHRQDHRIGISVASRERIAQQSARRTLPGDPECGVVCEKPLVGRPPVSGWTATQGTA